MLNIDNFLNKFYKNIKKTDFYKEQILVILEKHTKTKLSFSDIEIKNYIVFLKTSPGVLNKIFINKEKILAEINSISSELGVFDIRNNH
jgi:hypothetical protein